jgi:hypothetical protein
LGAFTAFFAACVGLFALKEAEISRVFGISLLARYMHESWKIKGRAMEDQRNYIEMEKSPILGPS